MKKLSEAQKREVLSEVPGVLRKLAAERDFYRNELLKRASRDRVEKLAAQMIEKGLRDGTVEAVANDLAKEAAQGNLDIAVTERAVELVSPDMLTKRAHLTDEVTSGNTELERFLVS